MDHEQMKSLSVSLYNYFSSKVGTEDVVQTRRIFRTVFDYVTSKDHLACISSGSKGEGLQMNTSDLDMMLLNKFVTVCERIETDVQTNTFQMVTNDTKPCFALLKSVSPITLRTVSISCVRIGPDLFLSSTNMKSWYQNILPIPSLPIIHGPCLSDENGEVDVAVCFRCKSWIEQARPWITRNRFWPTSELVNKIVDCGVFFVPIGCKDSNNEHLEWRISFSIAEKQLIFSFTHTQLLCYALLKILLKEIVDRDTQCKGLLCSYFLKTIIFCVSEELPATIWKPENLISCFMRVLGRLIYCVTYEIMPHYFITDNNLFENRFTENQRHYLLGVLSELYHRGIYCMQQSDTFSDFMHTGTEYWRYLIISEDVKLFNQLKVAHAIVPTLTSIIIMSSLEKLLNLCNRFKLKENRFIYPLLFLMLCRSIGNVNAKISGRSNKKLYNGQKDSLPYGIIGVRTDAVSGWLHLATYFYCMKQYKTTIMILDLVLQRCTPDKFYKFTDFANAANTHAIMTQIRQGHPNVTQMYRLHAMENLWFYFYFKSIPQELNDEMHCCFFTVKPPVVYAHFLSFLSFYHTRDKRKYEQSLRDLEITIKEGYFTGNSYTLATSYNCLGIAYKMLGKKRASDSCFRTSWQIEKDRYAEVMLRNTSK